MQESFSYRCERVSPERVKLTLGGKMSAQGLTELGGDLDDIFAEKPSSLCIIFDLLEVNSCDAAARTTLLEIQKRIANGGHRSAYVSNRPRLRGIALWVGHIADDRNSRPVTSLKQAEEWFSTANARLEEGIKKVSAPPRKKKRWWSR